MLFSPNTQALETQLKSVILRDSEGFFDNPKDGEDLQITVRIACEFYSFLQESHDPPELNDAEYMAGTIRAGLDWFFSMAQTGGILTGLELRKGFGSELPTSFAELKASYGRLFQQALECHHSAQAIGVLLSLVQLMFLFMTVYFPSFQSFSGETNSG